MTIFDRILLTLYALAVAVLSFVLITSFFGLPPAWSPLDMALALDSWEVVPVAAVFFLFSIRLLLSGVRKERPLATITHHSELGDVRISLGAVKNLAQKAAQSVRGVREAKISVTMSEGALSIEAKVSTSFDSTVPSVSSTLQEAIKNSVESSAGVVVKEVKILVEDMSPSGKTKVQ